MIHVAGLDLSLTATGVATDEGAGVLRPPRDHDRGLARLVWIRDAVLKVTVGPGADFVVLEGYSYGSQGAAIVSLGELGGVVRVALAEAGVRVVEVAPSLLKKFACGKGNAKKDEVFAAGVRAGCDESDNNAVDAWWLRQLGLYAAGWNKTLTATAYRDEVALKVRLPAGVHLAVGEEVAS